MYGKSLSIGWNQYCRYINNKPAVEFLSVTIDYRSAKGLTRLLIRWGTWSPSKTGRSWASETFSGPVVWTGQRWRSCWSACQRWTRWSPRGHQASTSGWKEEVIDHGPINLKRFWRLVLSSSTSLYLLPTTTRGIGHTSTLFNCIATIGGNFINRSQYYKTDNDRIFRL